MKIASLLIYSFAFAISTVISAAEIHVMRGQLDPTWGGASAESGLTQRRYLLTGSGIGEFKSDQVYITYNTQTLLAPEPEDAILILLPYYYDENQGVQAFDVIGGDASIGVLNYNETLWYSLTGMSNDELLAYCTPTNVISFEEAVQVGISYLYEKMTGAVGITLAVGDGNPEVSCKKPLSWLMTMRVHFSEERYRDVVVEVNSRGLVISSAIGL